MTSKPPSIQTGHPGTFVTIMNHTLYAAQFNMPSSIGSSILVALCCPGRAPHCLFNVAAPCSLSISKLEYSTCTSILDKRSTDTLQTFRRLDTAAAVASNAQGGVGVSSYTHCSRSACAGCGVSHTRRTRCSVLGQVHGSVLDLSCTSTRLKA